MCTSRRPVYKLFNRRAAKNMRLNFSRTPESLKNRIFWGTQKNGQKLKKNTNLAPKKGGCFEHALFGEKPENLKNRIFCLQKKTKTNLFPFIFENIGKTAKNR